MYFVFVIATTLVLPIGFTWLDFQLSTSPYFGSTPAQVTELFYFLGKWYVFWAGGVRLFLSGFGQTLGVRLTRKRQVEIESAPSEQIAQGVGFAKLLIGLLCIATEIAISAPGQLYAIIFPAAAVVAGLFYALSGLQHIRMHKRNARQALAMVTDLLVSSVLAVFLVLFATGVIVV